MAPQNKERSESLGGVMATAFAGAEAREVMGQIAEGHPQRSVSEMGQDLRGCPDLHL